MKAQLLSVFLLLTLTSLGNSNTQYNQRPHYKYFLDFYLTDSEKVHKDALKYIEENWKNSFEIYTLESMYFSQESTLRYQLLLLLERKTGQRLGYDYNAWYEYLWNKTPNYTSEYYTFKAILHSLIDPKFRRYFIDRKEFNTIRLDEIRWGGVVQDGIPPLRNPTMITKDQATYLSDSNVIFGIAINGEFRAYPKRILAWHEMFTDTVGGIPVAGVYCTLCGTVILYKTEHNNIHYQLGTSGFLYRSNKLMYDQKTQSLWNTLLGKPVLGPLVDQGIALEYLSVVTTTWGAWKKLHPETTVLSSNTGHQRDYGEGVAYQDYFATDKLMFNTPIRDTALSNKQEILAIRNPLETDEVIAISSKFLKKRPIYQSSIHGKRFTVFTDRQGAHRVYWTKDIKFKKYTKESQAIDSNKNVWTLEENGLKKVSDAQKLNRLPSYNAFWFGFKAAFPHTKLIK